MSYYLVSLVPNGDGTFREEPLPEYGPYEEGKDAAKVAKSLTVVIGRKVQPRRIAQADDWRETMRVAFDSKLQGGVYHALPAKWDLPPTADHFAHIRADDNLIGFIENDEHGVIGRFTYITPGRYISRFYPDVTDEHRRRLIAAVDPSGEVHFATTADEIEWVYLHGPDSCMAHPRSHWGYRSVHPVHAYAAGDLACAYLMNNQKRVSARVMCWPEKKTYGRMYGDESRLAAKLQEQGYTYNRVFEGVKLNRIKEKGDGQFILPYFDNIAGWIKAPEGENYFLTGYEDHRRDMEGTYLVGGNLARFCARTERWEAVDTFQDVHMRDGSIQSWSATAVRNYAVKTRDGSFWDERAVVTLGDGTYAPRTQWEAEGFTCEITGRRWMNDVIRVLDDGRKVHKQATVTPKKFKPAAQPGSDREALERRMSLRKPVWDSASEYTVFVDSAAMIRPMIFTIDEPVNPVALEPDNGPVF